MLILAKFLAGKINQNLWFQQSQSALFQVSYWQEEKGTLWDVNQSWTIWFHRNTPDKFTPQFPEHIFPFFFFFIENVTISVFTLSSEEKLGSMVLPVGALDKFHRQCPCIETDSREQIKPFHPLKPSLSIHTSLSPGLGGNLQTKEMCQVRSAARLHLSGHWWREVKHWPRAGWPKLHVCSHQHLLSYSKCMFGSRMKSFSMFHMVSAV